MFVSSVTSECLIVSDFQNPDSRMVTALLHGHRQVHRSALFVSFFLFRFVELLPFESRGAIGEGTDHRLDQSIQIEIDTLGVL
jgi:hypothetical protein